MTVSIEAGEKSPNLTGVQAPLLNRLSKGGRTMRKVHRKAKGRKHSRKSKREK